MEIKGEDISAQVFGKYQYCTRWKVDGMLYADSDFPRGGFGEAPRKGALPSLRQNTPELCAKAAKMHADAANPTGLNSPLWFPNLWKRLFG